MHRSSYEVMSAFVRVHLEAARGRPLEIVDFGSQMVDGQPLSYRALFDDPQWHYRGLDIAAGLNVDIVVGDAYDWSADLASNSVDLVISGQALEHVEYFWASMFEIVRVLKPGGVAAIIAPSAGFEHRYPVDCWRFYRDGFDTLARYTGCDVVDVFTDWDNEWSDSTLIARKPLWAPHEQELFDRRSAMQRALISDDQMALAYIDEGIGATGADTEMAAESPSILQTAQAGALTAELGAMRANRLRAVEEARTAQAEAAAAAAHGEAEQLRDALARAERAETKLAAALARAPEAHGVRAHPLYGRIRAAVADKAGTKGRSMYKRLRGREGV